MATITLVRSTDGFLRLRDDGLADILDINKNPTGQTQALTQEQQDLVNQKVNDSDDLTSFTFLLAQLPTMTQKAKDILSNPATAPDFTVREKKVIDALVVLDLRKRIR